MIPNSLKEYYRLHAPIYDISRWAFLFGRNNLNQFFPRLPDKASILDLGCGTGIQLNYLVSHYSNQRIIGLDQSYHMIKCIPQEISSKVEVSNEAYSEHSFPKNSLDLIVCSYSLSMMGEIEEVIETMKFHLKPDAYFLCVDFDNSPYSWFKTWMHRNHVNLNPPIFRSLASNFKCLSHERNSAYLGIYTFSTFLGRNY